MKAELAQFGDILTDVDLKKYNTYGIGGKAQYLIKPFDRQNLIFLLTFLKDKKISYYLLGHGSNVILPDEDFFGVIIKLDHLNHFEITNDLVRVEAGLPLNQLVNKTLNEGYTNLVALAGIPGTVGAAVRGNAGAFKHEIFNDVRDVTILNENLEVETLPRKKINYAYRQTAFQKRNIIILGATLKLEKGDVSLAQELRENNWQYRLNHQPIGTKNAGSVFKNPTNMAAGKLIEDLGFKGQMVGDAQVSLKHANFIVNTNEAKAVDILTLIKNMQKAVRANYDINLELEQIVVDWGKNERKED